MASSLLLCRARAPFSSGHNPSFSACITDLPAPCWLILLQGTRPEPWLQQALIPEPPVSSSRAIPQGSQTVPHWWVWAAKLEQGTGQLYQESCHLLRKRIIFTNFTWQQLAVNWLPYKSTKYLEARVSQMRDSLFLSLPFYSLPSES